MMVAKQTQSASQNLRVCEQEQTRAEHVLSAQL